MKPVLKPFITHNFSTAEVKNVMSSSFDGDIILPELVQMGEGNQLEQKAKPGAYIAYAIYRDGFDEHATMLVRKDEWTNRYHEDVNKVMDDIHIVNVRGVDGGTYGVAYGKPVEFEMYAEHHFAVRTNYGDGMFTLYSNDDNSVFVFDDEDILLGILHPKLSEKADPNENIDTFYEVDNDKFVLEIRNYKTKTNKIMEFDINTKYKEIVNEIFEYVDTLI